MNAVDIQGRAPLAWAAAVSRTAVMTHLLNAGAHVDTQSADDGATALYIFAANGCLAGVQMLLAAGASRALPDIHGQTLRDVAPAGHAAIPALL